MVDSVSDSILLKVIDGKVSASSGLDYLTNLHLNVVSTGEFWSDLVCTFRIKGKILLAAVLEKPELENCFARAKVSKLILSTAVKFQSILTVLKPMIFLTYRIV